MFVKNFFFGKPHYKIASFLSRKILWEMPNGKESLMSFY